MGKRAGWVLLLSLGLLQAQSYREIVKHITETPAMQGAQLLQKAAEEAAYANEGKELPSLDLNFQGAWLKDTPTMYLHEVNGITLPKPLPMPMGKTRDFIGELKLSYPLFTGFAISAQIDRSRLEAQQARLKVLDARRNLILNATELYGAIETTQATLQALYKAKKATLSALKKAEGLYKNGLIPPADLYNIKARVYDVDASITETRSHREQLLNQLSYLAGERISGLNGTIPLATPPTPGTLKQEAYRKRSDLRVLQTLLHIDEAQIRLAESRYYPTVGVAAALKRHGDTLALDGDGFTNADRSYVGVDLSWNLFNGGSDKHTVEAARYKKLSAASSLLDYRRRVDTEIDNAYAQLRALRSKLKSARMRVQAQKEYYKLTRGRFDNQLASADELSRSIADLANARAKKAAIESSIRVQKAKIWLLSGVESFERKLGIKAP